MIPNMPYAWLFRVCELMGAVLLLFAASRIREKNERATFPAVMLGILAFGAIIDLLFPTSCEFLGTTCQQIPSWQMAVHNIETVFLAGVFFVLTFWDAWKNKRIPSQIIVILQAVIGFSLALDLAASNNLTTFSSFFYQGCVVVWTIWFVTAEIQGEHRSYRLRQSLVNKVLAYWVGFQGIATILIGSAHFEIFKIFNGFYLSTHLFLLAGHSLVIGITFLYLSRHIARGERRAWQILMVLIGLEVIKYSVVLPQGWLLAFYLSTFAVVFTSKDFFNRGIANQTWRSKLYDAGIIAGIAAIVIVGLSYLLSYTGIYTNSTDSPHLITVLIVASIWFVLWTLFRPAPQTSLQQTTQFEIDRAEDELKASSNSTEDFFKLWPQDKEYFWSKTNNNFIAYKIVGPVAFALADPIAPSASARRKLLDQFISFCQERGWRTCFLLVDESSLHLYKNAGLNSMQIGASAVIDITKFTDETAVNKWWRWQRNKGQKAGYKYTSMEPPHSHATLQELREVSDEWLKRGNHQEESFALGYFNSEYLQRCRIHGLLNEDEKLVAFVNEVPAFNTTTQTTIDLIRFVGDAPHANNYLLYCLLHQLRDEGGLEYFDIGFVPLAQMKGRLANIARTLGANRFSAAGLEQFKSKFDPNWRKNYIAYEGDVGDLALIGINLEKAMAVDKNELGK